MTKRKMIIIILLLITIAMNTPPICSIETSPEIFVYDGTLYNNVPYVQPDEGLLDIDEAIKKAQLASIKKYYKKEESKKTAKEILGEKEYEILAKLLYAEAGICTEKGQIYTCSAILNLSKIRNSSIWDMAHDINTMAVAPYVDTIIPTNMQYEVIEYVVCGGGKVPEICYWRTKHYHSFGTPVCEIDGHFFSKR